MIFLLQFLAAYSNRPPKRSKLYHTWHTKASNIIVNGVKSRAHYAFVYMTFVDYLSLFIISCSFPLVGNAVAVVGCYSLFCPSIGRKSRPISLLLFACAFDSIKSNEIEIANNIEIH